MTTTRRSRSLTVAAASGLVAVLSALGLAACSSTPKDEIETALLGLPKNAAIRELGLQRKAVTMSLEGEEIDGELTYLRVPPRVHVTESLPPIVLVHGTPSSLFTWTPLVFGEGEFAGLVDALPEREIILIDIVGHGVTRTEAPPYSFQRCADWIAGALRALDREQVVLVGNSYGGEFVWRAALDHPDLVGRVVLLDSSGFPRADDEWLPEEEAMREMSLAYIGYVLNDRERIRTALEPHFPDGLSDDQLEEIYLVCDNSDNWEAMVDLARDEEGTRSGELKTLEQPTLLLWGEQDSAYGVERFARLFERDIPNARLVVIEGSGHYPQESRPADVARHLAEFLGGR